jgi:hypothetical protein
MVTNNINCDFYSHNPLVNKSQGKPFTLKPVSIAKRSIFKIIEHAENESGHKKVPKSIRVAKFVVFNASSD